MKDQTYLQWLITETHTKWWHDSAIPEEIDAALKNGALGVTTNPVLAYKSLTKDPDFWREEVQKIPNTIAGEERAEKLLGTVTAYAAGKVKHIYEQTEGIDGYAFAQLDPTKAADSAGMLKMAERFRTWAPNVAIKLPTTAAGLEVLEELSADGCAVCTTINFSVSQALAVAEVYRKGIKKVIKRRKKPAPCFAVQQIGRVDDYLRDIAMDMKLDLSEEEISTAGIAIAKRSYELYEKNGYEAVIMPAGLRGPHHVTELSGGKFTFSIHPRVQKMISESNLPRKEKVKDAVSSKILKKLKQIPDFIRAYEPDGLKPHEFITFGVAQKTLSQFVQTGWVPLENYGTTSESTRWT